MKRSLLARTLDRLHGWAESGWAGPAVGVWGVLQSSVVPGPSDTLLIPLGIADPPKVYRLAGWAWISSVIGGLIVYSIGTVAATESGRNKLEMVGVSEGMLASMTRLFANHGWWLVFFSAFGPLSTKLVCVVAGMMGMPVPIFFLSLAAGRGIRFLALALIIHAGGERLQRWVSARRGVPPAAPAEALSRDGGPA